MRGKATDMRAKPMVKMIDVPAPWRNQAKVARVMKSHFARMNYSEPRMERARIWEKTARVKVVPVPRKGMSMREPSASTGLRKGHIWRKQGSCREE